MFIAILLKTLLKLRHNAFPINLDHFLYCSGNRGNVSKINSFGRNKFFKIISPAHQAHGIFLYSNSTLQHSCYTACHIFYIAVLPAAQYSLHHACAHPSGYHSPAHRDFALLNAKPCRHDWGNSYTANREIKI